MALSAILLGAPFLSSAEGAPLQSFPAREILDAIVKSEQGMRDFSAQKRPPIDWEPWASPESSRSWLYFNLPPEALDALRTNRNLDGESIF